MIYKALPAGVRKKAVRQVREPDPIELELEAAPTDPYASPFSVRTANLDRVVDALAAAGVPCFRVPAQSLVHTVVAVPEEHRARAEAVLAELAGAGQAGARLQPVPLAEGEVTPREPVAPAGDEAAPAAADPVAIAVYWPVTDPGRRLLMGVEYACQVEFWAERDGRLEGPRYHASVEAVLPGDAEVEAEESVFGDFRPYGTGRLYRTREPFLLPPLEHVDFPIDVVYTWVDGGDPAWLARKNAALAENGWATGNQVAANNSRYLSRDELRYSLRSLHLYAPWVRRIFLVTDDQVPEWLNTEHPQLTVVSHKEIFGDAGKLPTFNSHAIETRLHHIEGLAEHFIYTNDDVFLGRPTPPGLFFTPSGQTRVYLSRRRIDAGPPTAGEPPVQSAGKNNRAIIEREFGRFLAFKIKHIPHAARRSVLREIEERCPTEIAATASHQFRHPGDVSLLSSLQQHWSYASGRAVVGEVQSMYRDLADPLLPKRLANALRKRHHQIFCLNDTDTDPAQAEAQLAALAEFLPAYFPFASPYER
ncbi:stealth family protein [Actinoplanes sp. CA-030573]|uniref:stealth family protein n=1 Tax=Actinoplanes sp. CA-030573 TaxID=3239898 RepID=UPI003D94FBA7